MKYVLLIQSLRAHTGLIPSFVLHTLVLCSYYSVFYRFDIIFSNKERRQKSLVHTPCGSLDLSGPSTRLPEGFLQGMMMDGGVALPPPLGC